MELESSHRRHLAAGVTAVAALYASLLLLVQGMFPENAAANINAVEVLVGLAGIAGGFAAARQFSPDRSRLHVAAGFGGSAVAAALGLVSPAAFPAYLGATIAAASLGWTAVALALCLRPTVHLRNLGLCCGGGIGLAYAFCNQPAVYTASRVGLGGTTLGLAALGILASRGLRGGLLKPSGSFDYRRPALALWLAVFLSLVWTDAATYFVIRHSPYLRPESWDGVVALQGNAFVHLCAAVLAGLALNRHQQAAAAGASALILLGACLFLDGLSPYFPAARVFYTAGVSTYAVALVYYAARSGRPRMAALIFAVAGWLGIAVGNIQSQALHEVPTWFVVTVTVLVIGVLIGRYYWLQQLRAVEAEVADTRPPIP